MRLMVIIAAASLTLLLGSRKNSIRITQKINGCGLMFTGEPLIQACANPCMPVSRTPVFFPSRRCIPDFPTLPALSRLIIEKSDWVLALCSFFFSAAFVLTPPEETWLLAKSSLTMLSGTEEREKNFKRVDCWSMIWDKVLRSSWLTAKRGIKAFAKIDKDTITAKIMFLSGE